MTDQTKLNGADDLAIPTFLARAKAPAKTLGEAAAARPASAPATKADLRKQAEAIAAARKPAAKAPANPAPAVKASPASPKARPAAFEVAKTETLTLPAPKNLPKPGSKLDFIAKLFRRPGGATMAELLKETGWKVFAMRRTASDAGIGTLVVETDKDGVKHYRAG